MCAAQESVFMPLLDVMALKNPGAHASHWGWVVAEPPTLVYLPHGHFLWAVQAAGDRADLKNPVAHGLH